MTFQRIYELAIARKGSIDALNSILPVLKTPEELAQIDDSRYLSTMAKGINQAGFHWQVIENKWPEFEEAFLNFNVHHLALLPDEAWDNYMADRRVVRNWQKIEAVKKNAIFLYHLAQQHGTAAHFFAHWPQQDQFGLTQYLKKNGSRLGGMTGQLFLRRMGWDSYILSQDVCVALKTHAGLDIADQPTSQKDLKQIQQQFNAWHTETHLPYSHLSKIAAYAVGQNNSVDLIAGYMQQDEL